MSDGNKKRIEKPWSERRVGSRKPSILSVHSARQWCIAWLLAISPITQLYAQSGETADKTRLQSRPLYQATQQALDRLTRAEIDREEASLGGQSLDSVRKQCRAAISQLRFLETQLTKLLRKSYQQPLSAQAKNSWSVRELESLLRHLKVQQARAYRNQALCYSDASTDRVNALSLALKQLADIVTLPLDDASVWQARIEQVVCLRLLKTNVEAKQQIERWQNASPPAKIASRLTAEALRIDLDQGAIPQALAKVVALLDDQDSLAVIVPETDDAILEILLAARRRATPELSTHLTQRATRQLQRISAVHGPYWQRRAEVRFGRALT